MSVRYADIDIGGSPYYVEVLDPDQIRVSDIPQTAVRDQRVRFTGRLSVVLVSLSYTSLFIKYTIAMGYTINYNT